MNVLKAVAMFALVVIISVIMGVALTDPLRLESIGTVASLLALILFPLLIRWHGYLFAFSVSSGLIVPFVPGKPYLWVALAGVTLLMATVERTLLKKQTYRHVPEIAWPLVCFVAVAFVTMFFRGGLGGQAFGSDQWGARRYYLAFGGVMAFFAFCCLRIPVSRAKVFTAFFFGSGIMLLLTDLAFWSEGRLSWIYLFFHYEASSVNRLTEGSLDRSQGAAYAAIGILSTALCLIGLKRLLEPRRWWVVGVLALVFLFGMLGGFRSIIVVFLVLLAVLLWLERLYLSPKILPFVFVMLVIIAGLAAFSTSLPLTVQRAISFLPVEVDPLARVDASNSTLWRLEIWKVAWQEVPQYLWLGKGFTYSGADLQWVEMVGQRISAIEWALVGSWYHSGPLTLLICLGLPGTITFVWFWVASLRYLRRQWEQSGPELKTINLFIYALFLQRVIHFVFFYGQIELDVVAFTTLVGLSVAINVPTGSAESKPSFGLPLKAGDLPQPVLASAR